MAWQSYYNMIYAMCYVIKKSFRITLLTRQMNCCTVYINVHALQHFVNSSEESDINKNIMYDKRPNVMIYVHISIVPLDFLGQPPSTFLHVNLSWWFMFNWKPDGTVFLDMSRILEVAEVVRWVNFNTTSHTKNKLYARRLL